MSLGFELDKHDLFRTAVPGFIFLFVLFTFYLFNNNYHLDPTHDINTFLTVMVVAITLPIGYLIHNIYRAYHVLLREQRDWEIVEADRLKKLIGAGAKLDAIQGDEEQRKDKSLSWFLEVILHSEGYELIRDRGYTLISRVHSAGSVMMAIFCGCAFSLWYFIWVKGNNINLDKITFLWILVGVLLWVARTNAVQGYQSMIKHVIDVSAKKIILVAQGDLNPFNPYITDKKTSRPPKKKKGS